MYKLALRESQSQDGADGGGLYHRAESLIVVHTGVKPRRTQRALYQFREPSALNLLKSAMRKSNRRTESTEQRSWSSWSLESITWKERVRADVGSSPPDSRCCRRPLLFPLFTSPSLCRGQGGHWGQGQEVLSGLPWISLCATGGGAQLGVGEKDGGSGTTWRLRRVGIVVGMEPPVRFAGMAAQARPLTPLIASISRV
jgi:hypothetical protein